MYRLWAPQTVRAMLGHGCLIARTPSTSFPWSSSPDTGSMMAGSMPKNGSEALPGLVGVTPPNGEMMWHPVSVCQYVYTVCQRLPLAAKGSPVGTHVYYVRLLFPDDLMVPFPHLCGDRFSDRAQHSEMLHLVFDMFVTGPLQQT